jgi:DNA ligase-associated metallophosphoesterase
MGHRFLLSAARCLFWEAEQTLVLSDLHLGKSGHFRKAGIAVPQEVFREDLHRLFSLLQQFKPARMLVIGDLFHSRSNLEHDWFLKWRKDLAQLQIELVMGNHDILDQEYYQSAGIHTAGSRVEAGPFAFVHDFRDPAPENSSAAYIFSGHIHPAIRIPGVSRQTLCLPCFYFSKKYAVLPAFGRFTGTHTIQPKRGEAVFALVPGEQQPGILQIQ